MKFKVFKTFSVIAAMTVLISCGGESSGERESVDVESFKVSVGDFQFDAVAAGEESDVPVIFLHGFAATSYQFHKIMGYMGAQGFYTVAFDQRGYSPDARPSEVSDYRLEFIAQDVISVADELGFDRFHLVGHDYGAMVAWAVGAQFPERVISLVPISTPHPQAFIQAFFDPNSNQAEMSAYAQDFVSPGYEQVMLENDAAWLLDFFAEIDMDYTDVYLESVANEEALRAALNWYRAADWEWNLALNPIVVPTMYMWSTNDIYLSSEAARATENFVFADYQYIEFEGLHHFIPEARGGELTDLLLEFFSGKE